MSDIIKTSSDLSSILNPSLLCNQWLFLTYNYLKVHKHEIFLNFFFPKSNPYMPLVNFRKKFRIVSFDFRQNFEVRTFTR
jgi:hypothetical protein